MDRDEIKELIRQVIIDMSNTHGIATEITTVANTTGNVAGFDMKLAKPVERKLKDEYLKNDEEDD